MTALPDHGDRRRYLHRSFPCRCERCRRANADYQADIRDRHRRAERFTWAQVPTWR